MQPRALQVTKMSIHSCSTIAILAALMGCIGLIYGQATDPTGKIPSTTFKQSYYTIWGQPYSQQNVVQLKLDKSSGSGFKSIHKYQYGFFSALIKLPAKYTAGVVTAFYASNYDEFPQSHDELDFEFLGVVPGTPYVLQTNIYGDGSVNMGREERINLWFDPTADFHRYSILWNSHQLVFFVDQIPIRRMVRSAALGKQYPSKPMHTYSTIWDGSGWATDGGKFPVNYAYSPFVSAFTGFKLQECELQHTNCTFIQDLTQQQKRDLAWARANHMIYSYCEDRQRYPTPLPECRSSSTHGSRKHKQSYKEPSKNRLKFGSLSPALRLGSMTP